MHTSRRRSWSWVASGIAQCTAEIGATLHEAEQYAAAEPELTRTVELYVDLDDRRGAGPAERLRSRITALAEA
ncbi:hypothetical protein ACPC54_38440 [Kitasatospora sp. NPDC094028]